MTSVFGLKVPAAGEHVDATCMTTPSPSQNGNGRIERLAASRRIGHTLEQAFYTDEEIFRRDLEQIFGRCWLYAGHVRQIPAKGDFFVYEVANESILVTRGSNGQIHALFNVCRHRGSKVCLESKGNAKSFTCPYHAWTYGLDGALLAARHMDDAFEKSTHGLHRCRVEVMEGLIFINLAADPSPFATIRNDLQPFLAPYGLEHAKVCHHSRDLVKANWKLLMENYFECYHCPCAHPEFASVNMHVRAQNSPVLAEDNRLYKAEWEAKAKGLGQNIGHVLLTPQTYHYCGREPIGRGWVSQTQNGKPAAPLMGSFREYDGGVTGITILCFSFIASNDHAALIRFTPVSPTETISEVWWFVREDAVEGRDYDVSRVIWLWKTTFEQDYKICTDNQSGILSSRYQPGPYSKNESWVDLFVQWYVNQLK